MRSSFIGEHLKFLILISVVSLFLGMLFSVDVFAMSWRPQKSSPKTPLKPQLKVATFNVGMLGVGSPVPFLEERQEVLGERIATFLNHNQVEVLSIQEAWTDQSLAALRNVHPDYELIVLGRHKTETVLEHDNGLALLVKRSLNATGEFFNFHQQEGELCAWGLVCDRGILQIKFEFQGQKVVVLNTHLEPTLKMIHRRQAQMNEVISHKNELLAGGDVDMVLVAADLSSGPIFGQLKGGDEGTHQQWVKNMGVFSSLLRSEAGDTLSGCRDTHGYADTGASIFNFTQNRRHNIIARISPSTGIEPNQRIDHVVQCGGPSWNIDKIELLFQGPFLASDGETGLHLSDHYGLMVTLSLPSGIQNQKEQ
jgi:endonuclease/exonuclease/phosphatase family metal-dependent hydrolase